MEGTNLAEVPRLVCQAESLWRLKGADKYNLVLMDESESILMQLSSDTTMSDCAGLVTGVLYDVLLKGDKVVLADAYITSRTLNLVHHIFNTREEKVKVIYNSWCQEPRKAYRLVDKQQFKEELIKRLKSGKNCVAFRQHNNKCYIFERADPYLEEKPGRAAVAKDGLHLMFPFIRCFDRLKWMARDHVIQECRTLFEQLGTTNTIDDIVDKAVISTNNWFVYLSSKPNRQPYKLTRVLDNALKDVAFKESRKLVPFLSVAGDVENVSYIKELPSPEGSGLAQRQQPARTRPQLDHQHLEDQQHDQVGFTLLQQAVMGLQNTRADGYENWFKVVCGINNIRVKQL
ncbi:hypothetical protein ABBQ32_000743 [Trebouxia sp. C0010 RCD-2024]